jgi:hypothetical protein
MLCVVIVFVGSCGPYRLPYEDVVGQNPTVHALNEVVIKKGRRPIIREEWRKHEVRFVEWLSSQMVFDCIEVVVI